MSSHPRLRRVLTALLVAGSLATVGLASAPSASAHVRPTGHPAAGAHHASAYRYGGRHSLGTTTVTTAPGIATTLLGAGVAPLPVWPETRFGVGFRNGLVVSYGFPIVGNTANLKTGTGDITHAGGIRFVSRSASLEVGRFDIDLAAATIYATEVNGAPGKVALLDLDLSGLKVTTIGRDTVLSGITVKLDPAGAKALNATFGLPLPTDGSLTFGTATVRIAG